MTPRQKRTVWVSSGLLVLALISFFVIQALRANMVFFYSPTEIMEGTAPLNQTFRVGGMVSPGSVKRLENGVQVQFRVTDTTTTIPVVYKGSLPDLFKEGQGVVAQGQWDQHVFNAHEVLAKHDENYMPPEAQHSIKQAQKRTLQRSAP